MGNRLDGFEIKLTFGSTGVVEKIEYVDQEGCGHSAPFGPRVPIGEITRYHLDHYDKSHKMRPEPRCGFETHAQIPGVLNAHRWRCTAGPHDDQTPHTFEMVPGS